MTSTLRLPAFALGLLLAAPATAQVEASASKAALKKASAAAQSAWQAQNWDDAATAYGKVVKLDEDNAMAWHHLGYALHALGRLDEAVVAHKKAATFPQVAGTSTYNVACVEALRGNKDAAFEWLHKAAQAGFNNAQQIKTDSDMDSLREDPRFEKFLAKLTNDVGTAAGARAFVVDSPRQSSRLFFWGQNGSPGQIVVNYGQPEWKPEYAKAIDSEKFMNTRWRMGKDFWTNLDTNLDLTVAGVEIPAGFYYLTLEHREDGKFILAFNDPAMVRKHKLDAYLAQYTKGGIEVELTHKVVDEVAEKLQISVKNKAGDNTKGKFALHFGNHALVAPVEIHFSN